MLSGDATILLVAAAFDAPPPPPAAFAASVSSLECTRIAGGNSDGESVRSCLAAEPSLLVLVSGRESCGSGEPDLHFVPR